MFSGESQSFFIITGTLGEHCTSRNALLILKQQQPPPQQCCLKDHAAQTCPVILYRVSGISRKGNQSQYSRKRFFFQPCTGHQWGNSSLFATSQFSDCRSVRMLRYWMGGNTRWVHLEQLLNPNNLSSGMALPLCSIPIIFIVPIFILSYTWKDSE